MRDCPLPGIWVIGTDPQRRYSLHQASQETYVLLLPSDDEMLTARGEMMHPRACHVCYKRQMPLQGLLKD
jgi:hypothetical protein